MKRCIKPREQNSTKRIIMKDNNNDNGIVAVKHGNVRARKRHPCTRASPVFEDEQTFTYKSILLNYWRQARSASVEECTTPCTGCSMVGPCGGKDVLERHQRVYLVKDPLFLTPMAPPNHNLGS